MTIRHLIITSTSGHAASQIHFALWMTFTPTRPARPTTSGNI